MPLLPRALVLALLPACATARAPVAEPASPPPIAAPTPPDGVVATRIPVAYHNVGELARVLEDIFDVRPDRGDVRVILHDGRASTLIVFATPAGLESIRRLLGPTLAPASTPSDT